MNTSISITNTSFQIYPIISWVGCCPSMHIALRENAWSGDIPLVDVQGGKVTITGLAEEILVCPWCGKKISVHPKSEEKLLRDIDLHIRSEKSDGD